VKIDKKIRARGIADFFQTLLAQILLDGSLYFATKGFVVRRIFAAHSFASGDHIAGYDRARTATAALFLGGLPCPGGMTGNANIRVSRDVDVFIAPGEQNGTSESAGGEKRRSGFQEPLRLHLQLLQNRDKMDSC
jgi:hypothetical protein